MSPRSKTPRGEPCPRCGEIHGKCTGHSSRTGQPCKQNPIDGLTVCKFHGGGTKAARAAGRRRVTEAAAVVEAARFATRRDIHPADALLELVQWTAGEVDYWRGKVDGLDDDELAGALVTKTEVGEDKGQPTDLTTTEAAEHIYIRMLGKASDRLATYAAAALRAGVDERRVRIAEQQGALFVTAQRAILARMFDAMLDLLRSRGVSDTDIEEALRAAWDTATSVIVPEELRRLGKGDAA